MVVHLHLFLVKFEDKTIGQSSWSEDEKCIDWKVKAKFGKPVMDHD